MLSGPYCALLLGELGAEVIKIEKPGRGDHSRRPRGGPGGTGLRFLAWNMYRKSLTLDIWKPEGKEIFRQLVAKSDVVLENFRPDVMAKAGLDFEALKEINPGIVLASITGFGQNTSFSQYTAHASVISAFTGIQHMNRFGDSPPTPTPGASPDIAAGTHAAIGILAALVGRNATGRGRHVDISMVDATVGQYAFDLMTVLLTGGSPPSGSCAPATGTPRPRPGRPSTSATRRATAGSTCRPTCRRSGTGWPRRSCGRTRSTTRSSPPRPPGARQGRAGRDLHRVAR